ncbi:MAG: ankyrin repeat domain-containing protein [Actinomycetaceae bacterium]|nr:ankyrin repeat domain-containing protein [Actinomycetaceae bacterium]
MRAITRPATVFNILFTSVLALAGFSFLGIDASLNPVLHDPQPEAIDRIIAARNYGYDLVQAVGRNDQEAVRHLLNENGANPNAHRVTSDHDINMTALTAAIAQGNMNIFMILLDAGADVNTPAGFMNTAKEGEGWTPLMNAILFDQLQLAEILLNRGANVNASARKGRMKGKTREGTKEGTTALHIAAEKGYANMVQLLLSRGANINAAITSEKQKGQTALMIAAKNGHTEIVRILLEKGASATAGTDLFHPSGEKEFITPMTLAVKNGHIETVKTLLEKGVNANSSIASFNTNTGGSVEGCTVLMYAVSHGYTEIASALIEKGANVNAVATGGGEAGATPLILAVMSRDEEITRRLLDKGADANAATRSGKTALSIASEQNHEALINMLKKAGAK